MHTPKTITIADRFRAFHLGEPLPPGDIAPCPPWLERAAFRAWVMLCLIVIGYTTATL